MSYMSNPRLRLERDGLVKINQDITIALSFAYNRLFS